MSIIFDHVSFRYDTGKKDEKRALDDISFTIRDHDFVGIIGHTGSGKSTLIQHMNGLLLPEEGAVYFNGEDITDRKYNRNELRKKIGLVFQYPESQLFSSTVIEDVKFGPKNMGLEPLQVDLRAFEALKLVGIEDDLLDASPFELSGGQKRRVAIAGVLAMQPEVLIMDEPTAGLDPKGREELYGMLQKLHREKKLTIIVVSHSMEDMAKYADRLIVMNQGKVLAQGTPKEVFRYADELETVGLSAPVATRIIEELKKRNHRIDGNAVTVEEAADLICEYLKGEVSL